LAYISPDIYIDFGPLLVQWCVTRLKAQHTQFE
jgi:hypothetical protein